MKRILVADDLKDVAESIRDMLEGFYDVEIVESGREVLQRCRKNYYDGLIIDVHFRNGGVDGLYTAEALRKTNKEIRILLFSAHDLSSPSVQRLLAIGATFRLKPLHLDDVRNVMEGATYGQIAISNHGGR